MKTIKQTVQFKATPAEVYKALMDSKIHSKFTGSKAVISPKVGGKFTAYDGYAEGTNVKLVPDKLIVQSWRADDWPEGVYSEATFKISKTSTGSKLTFIQTGVPDEQSDSIKQGWYDYYWEPMQAMFDK